MKPMKALLGFSILASMTMTPLKASAYSEFRDLKHEVWYEEYINHVLQLGLIDGVDGQYFEPEQPIRSVDAAKAFYRLAGSPYWVDAAYYSDVTGGTDSLAVSYCIDMGIMSGYTDGTFRPDESISEPDLFVMLYCWALANGMESGSDPERPLSERAAAWAAGNGLQSTDGTGGTTEPVSRARASELFSKASDLKVSAADAPAETAEVQNEQAQPEEAGQESAGAEQVSEADSGQGSVLQAKEDQNTVAQQEAPADTEMSADILADQESGQGAETGFSWQKTGDDIKNWVKGLLGYSSPEPNPDAVHPGSYDEGIQDQAAAYGIDISEHQGDIDLSPYQGQFVIIRAGWHDREDLQFRSNVAKCEKLGIPYGVYWYSYALDEAQAEKEAQAFADTIAGTNPSMGVWIDIEKDAWKEEQGYEISSEHISSIALAMSSVLQENGWQPGVYTSAKWSAYLDERLAGLPRWIACYGNDDGNIHADYSGQAVMLQYTSNPIDKNILYRPQSLDEGN